MKPKYDINGKWIRKQKGFEGKSEDIDIKVDPNSFDVKIEGISTGVTKYHNIGEGHFTDPTHLEVVWHDVEEDKNMFLFKEELEVKEENGEQFICQIKEFVYHTISEKWVEVSEKNARSSYGNWKRKP